MRRLSAVLVALLSVAVLAGLAPPASAAPVTYRTPVDGRVTEGFRPPATAYGAGNRGLTYETQPGGPVRASAPGRVSFAGQVGGALHVVVQHADGVRTSYSFLRAVSAKVGDRVDAGALVGSSGSSFHFGARIGDAYIDPAILLASGPAQVHLVPDGEFSETGASDDHRSLLSVVADRVGSVSGGALAWARDTGGDAAQSLGAAGETAFREAVMHMVTVLDAIVNLGQMAGPYAALAAALADMFQAMVEECTSPEVAKPKVAERRVAVFVAGLGSSSSGPDDPNNLSKRLRATDLYAEADTYDFSYKGGRTPEAYEARDTVRDLRKDASDLRALLDRVAAEHPGVPVDLIAHSQGGLIAREALASDYDRPGHRFPPVAHLVTLGTPHHGSDVATFNAWLRWTPGGRALRHAGNLASNFDLGGPGIAQLAETSEFIATINRRDLRDGVEYTSIGAAHDWVVPAVRARLAGATNVLVDAGNIAESHTGLTETDSAHRELALALSDMPPTCQPLVATARRGFTSSGLANGEDLFGTVVAGGVANP